jgi:flagellin
MWVKRGIEVHFWVKPEVDFKNSMAISVQTNVTAMRAQGDLNRSHRALSSNFARISSGKRINKAGDDAAGLAVAENLNTQNRSATMAKRNINDGISIIQTMEGALNEIGDILKRQKELAIQYSSETLADTERAYVVDEFEELRLEVDRTASNLQFNGIPLTHVGSPPTGSELNVQVGVNDSDDDRIAIGVFKLHHDSLRYAATKQSGVNFSKPRLSGMKRAREAIDGLGYMLDVVNSYRSKNGAVENRLEAALNNMETYGENLGASESRVRDADFAFETAEMSKHQIMQQAGTAILSQANSLPQSALRLI